MDQPPQATDETSLATRLSDHVREHRTGMLYDLLFALTWVTLVSAVFDHVLTGAPRWAYYLCLAGGIPAYFGFILSLAVAREQG